MDYAMPATAWQGLLSGLGHPLIGVDHLLFVIGAGVLAARVKRGVLLPLVFVGASITAVAAGSAGAVLPLGELWVALSLLALGGALLVSRGPARGAVAALFLLAGAVHGYALAESIVGAEQTPLYGYLAGLTVALSLIALTAWAAADWLGKARPALPLDRVAGISLGVAGLYFTVIAGMG
jgi:urease accessory protein